MAARNGTDRWHLPPVDAPEEPVKGLRVWVQTGDHWALGENYSVSRVNSRSFYVSHDGTKQRHDLDRWSSWLAERDAEGFVVLDGHPMRPPLVAALAAGLPRLSTQAEGEPMRKDLRDARLLRAVRDVLRGYAFVDEGPTPEGLQAWRVTRGPSSYRVEVDPAWERPPRCTCPDAARVEDDSGATFCKHTVAVLLTRAEHHHQLIDLLL